MQKDSEYRTKYVEIAVDAVGTYTEYDCKLERIIEQRPATADEIAALADEEG